MHTGPNGESCVEFLHLRKIEFSGQSTSTVYLINPHGRQVEKIRVDGCAIYEGMRCDWMARTTGGILHEEVFIELKKATPIEKASDRLESTIKKLSDNRTESKKYCLVVGKSRKLISTVLQKIKVRFKRDYNAEFFTVQDGDEIEVDGGPSTC